MRRSSCKTIKQKRVKHYSAIIILVVIVSLVILLKGGGADVHRAGLVGEGSVNRPNLAVNVIGHRKILDRHYREMAVSFRMKSLYALPLEIPDIDATAVLLAEDLELDGETLAYELKSERSFFWLARLIPAARADAILKRAGRGIYAREEDRRFYPAQSSASHVLGFIEKNRGLAGVEFYYDHILRSDSQQVTGDDPIVDGHLQLTLDLGIQKLLESELGRLGKETAAPSGSGIVMDMQSGAILALASFPGYDPNFYWNSKSNGRINRAVNGLVDVGGFKYLFGKAAAYEEYQDNNQGQLAALKMDLLRDSLPEYAGSSNWFEPYGDDLLSPELRIWAEGSIADGVGTIADRVGLFRKSGIDLPEDDGANPRSTTKTTPIRLLTAFTLLSNGGTGITPHLGEAIIAPDYGRRSLLMHPAKKGVLKPLTSKKTVGSLQEISRSGPGVIVLESLRKVEAVAENMGVGTEKPEVRSENRYQAVMVGFTPGRQAGIVVLFALDGAVVNVTKKTPMRVGGEILLEQAMGLLREKAGSPGAEEMEAREKLMYDKWLASGFTGKQDAEVYTGSGIVEQVKVMPDLNGFSLRKALRNLQRFDLKVKISGSGRVVDQKPTGGSSLSGGECLLTLALDN